MHYIVWMGWKRKNKKNEMITEKKMVKKVIKNDSFYC